MPRTVPVRRPTPELARSASASWATGALDEVRREVCRTARQAGATTPVRHRSPTIRLSSGVATDLTHARYALWTNPEHLPVPQPVNLACIENTHPHLLRTYP